MLTLTGLDEVKDYIGKELGVSDWHLVTQEKIDEFAEVTGDDQWIHIDPERAKQSPFGGTIAHGYYTLSLAPRFSYDMVKFEGFAFGVNYGLNRVRFRPRCLWGRRCACAPSSSLSRTSPAARRSPPS